MSFLDRMVGKKLQPPTTSEAIQKLREIEDMLMKKQEYMESKIDHELRLAKKNAPKNKPAALQALRRKKRFEKQLQQIDNTITTIEMQREALEVANANTTVLKTMKNAADALKRAHLHVDVDKVNNMMDDIADQQDLANEIANAISNPVGFGADVDEDELEKELDELEQEALEEKLVEVPEPHVWPEVPSERVGQPSRSRTDSEDEIKELKKWAS